MTAARTCEIAGCDKPHEAKGYCHAHYENFRTTGSPIASRPSLGERFWAKVVKTPTCWLWTGSTNYGYGVLRVGGRAGRPVGAHRISYEMHSGLIPDGADIDHMCHNRACVNPDHLQAVTRKQNLENLDHRQFKRARGVHWRPDANVWAVWVSHNNRGVYGGHFRDFPAAVAASIALRNELYTNNLMDKDDYELH